MNISEEIRTAADRLHEAYDDATKGPWGVETAYSDRDRGGVLGVYSYPAHDYVTVLGGEWVDESRANGDYIALMHPAVGLAVADWLTDEVTDYEQVPDDLKGACVPTYALKVAQAINGTTP